MSSVVHEIFLRAHVDDSTAPDQSVSGLNLDAEEGAPTAACANDADNADVEGKLALQKARFSGNDKQRSSEESGQNKLKRTGSDTWLPSLGRRFSARSPGANDARSPGPRQMQRRLSKQLDEEETAKQLDAGLQAIKAPRRHVQVGDVMLEDSFLQKLVRHPGSKYRMVWDIIGVLFVAYDGFMIPFMQAFYKAEVDPTLSMLMLVSTVFWTCDIPMSFLVGYHVEGLIEMRMSRIGKRYFKTWMIPDVGIVTLDWMFIGIGLTEAPTASDNSAGLARVARTVRVFRMLRIVRLLRLPKLFRKIRELHARIRNELLRVCFQMWFLVGVMVILTHFVACGWYAVGICSWGDIQFCQDNVERSWTFAAFGGEAENNLMYRYTTSLQWAAAQVTVGNSEIDATCLRERCYSVLVVWFGLIVFSVFVSSITTNMTQLRQINAEQFNDEESLKSYLVEHRVSVELGRCIMDFFHVHRREQKLQARQLDLGMLQVMPEGLRRQLAIEVFLPGATCHPFFRFMREVDRSRLEALCYKAMHEVKLNVMEELFDVGDVSKGLYFLHKGTMSYTIDPEIQLLQGGQWVAEATLWMSRWIHCGRFAASDSKAGAELMMLSADDFRSQMRGAEELHDVKVLRYGAAYAISFAAHHCEGTGQLLFRRTDIWGTQAELSEMASSAADCTHYEWRGSR